CSGDATRAGGCPAKVVGVGARGRVWQDMGAGWDLILPAGWAPVFFHALVLAGARAVSLMDDCSMALELGLRRFPADYPDTASGRRHWDEYSCSLEEAWAQKRPKHRGVKLRRDRPERRPPQLPPASQAPAPAPAPRRPETGCPTPRDPRNGVGLSSSPTTEPGKGESADPGQGQSQGRGQGQGQGPSPFRPAFESLASGRLGLTGGEGLGAQQCHGG
ncbi:unnamed protein product, partial [Discosporangium mesarthrocarpum]